MAKSGNIQCHYDSSKNVHDISTVSVRYRYESMTIHGGNVVSKIPRFRYGAPRLATISWLKLSGLIMESRVDTAGDNQNL